MKYVCKICGHVYDEAKEKIPFADLPADWKCPRCGAAKGDFQAEQEKPQGDHFRPIREDAHLKELSAGQLSALCSNLARGCEKQYKAEEATLFRELAAYFAAVTPPVEDACVEGLEARLLKDVDDYADVRATADANGDRGAARVCVWGEKVTRMLSSLVDRYLKEGEAMLANAQVWVCTVCGFVYVGEECPEICPVCKVPAWKFEKIEGRTKK